MNLREPIYKAQINKLAEALENPASVHSSQNQNGYVCLSGENANWLLCARVAHTALRGRHHYKATSLVFEIGRKVIIAHGWQDREPPVSRPDELSDDDDAVWIDGIDRRPKQFHQQCIGSYCLTVMILLGYCSLEWSNHKDYECYVVLLPNESPLAKEPTTYTQFRPFEPWWQSTDEHRHELVKTDLGTNWQPAGWHFTGQPPSPNEQRLWHPYQDIWRRTNPTDDRYHGGGSGTSLLTTSQQPVVYRAETWQPEWIQAVNKHEAVPYRINKEMLRLVEQLDIVDEDNPASVSFIEEAKRLAGHDKFYQRVHLDFRGRMYTSRSLVNYQGDDEYRCLIEFAEGVELDDSGYQALLFHAANLWGPPALPHGDMPKYFKLVQVGKWMLEDFISYADDPVGTYGEWSIDSRTGDRLDDPLLFIRACMELRDATTKKRMIRKKGFISHLPVEVDQSNSVMQHLSLFYGDRDVADMCNLITESDFYTQIAEGWEIAGLTDVQKRKIAKKIVVPRCYGAGKRRIAEQELDKLPFLDHMDIDEKVALAREGIRRVEAAVPTIATYREEMKDVITRWGLPPDGEMAWATISGFEVHFRPVYVDLLRFRVPKSKEERKYRVQLNAKYVSPRLHNLELKRGLQANLVHSVDASLAHMVVAKAKFPVIAVHDAFAAHANNIDDLRIEFAYNLISVHLVGKPLQNFRSDVLGEPRPEGLLGYTESMADTVAILRDIQGRAFLEMIG